MLDEQGLEDEWGDLDDDGASAHRYRLHSEIHGVDGWLDQLESVLIAIRQRELTPDQLDRYARLIHGARHVALTRARVSNLRKHGMELP